MSITRRIFLRSGGLAVVGTAAIPAFLTRAACAAESLGANNKRLVVIFQRGAADGLNIVVPHAERAYYSMRPSINIPRNAVIELDGFFGLHPALAPFQPLWKQRHLAIVHAVGSPDPTRSHFDAQDFMESGTPGIKATEDGWLNRALHSASPDQSAFRAIALGPSMPRILSGSQPAVAINNINDFGVGGNNPKASPNANSFEAMYEHSVDSVLHGTGQETFEAVKMLKSADPGKYKPAPGADYPNGRFGDSLKQLAQLIKANLGVQVAFADIGGWDHHVNEGSTQGQIANVLARILAIASRLLDRPRRPGRRHGSRNHVRVRPHRPRKRKPRHRPRPRQRNVRNGRPGKRRQSLRTLAGPRPIATLRRPRPSGHHRFSPSTRRSGLQASGKQSAKSGIPRLRQSTRKIPEVSRIERCFA